jgi:hypothetical protein
MTKAKKFRAHFSGDLPTGQACMRTAGAGRVCDRCGQVPAKLHVLTRAMGAFCAEHCPVCNPAPEPKAA